MMMMLSKSHPFLVGRNVYYNRILSLSSSFRNKYSFSTIVVHSNQKYLKSSLSSKFSLRSLDNNYNSNKNEYPLIQRHQCFSSQQQNDDEEEEGGGMSLEMKQEMDKRHHGIMMNPNGLSRTILPGDFVIKTNEKTGSKRKVYADRALGYFWMIKDLKDTNNKPIVSSPSIIPVDKAKMFPSLSGNLTTIDGGETVTLPEYITRLNRSEDELAQCTLMTVSFNDYGYNLLPSWTEPFAKEMLQGSHSGGRSQIIRVVINQGTIIQYLSRWVRNSFAKQQQGKTIHEYETTLLFFGSECPNEFRDTLRMHNTMTGYVFLLDGLGRVRWAGSGSAENNDVEKLIQYAKELTPLQNKSSKGNRKGSNHRHMRT